MAHQISFKLASMFSELLNFQRIENNAEKSLETNSGFLVTVETTFPVKLETYI